MFKRIALSLLGLSAAMVMLGTVGHKIGSTPRAEAAAYSLSVVDQQCLSSSSVRLMFNWGSYNEGPQWMDLSLSNNDFVPGTFVGVGPIPVGQNTFTWDGILPGLTHYIRINTLTPAGWSSSQTFSFTSRADCAFAPPPPTVFGQGANNLIVVPSCVNGQPHLSLNWQPSGQGVQYIDDSQINTSFQGGTFPSMGPLAPTATNFEWDSTIPGAFPLNPGSIHYLRVNTGTQAGWIGSNVVTMIVPGNCQVVAQPTATATATVTPTATVKPSN